MTDEERFNKNINIAYKNLQDYRNCGIEYEDLKQICLLGLWVATKTFKEEKGFAFSSYAYTVIQNQIRRNLRKNKKHYITQYLSDSIFDNMTIGDTLIDEKSDIENIDRQIDARNIVEQLNTSILREDKKKILALYMRGYKQETIARIVGCSQPEVSRTLKRIAKQVNKKRMIRNGD